MAVHGIYDSMDLMRCTRCLEQMFLPISPNKSTIFPTKSSWFGTETLWLICFCAYCQFLSRGLFFPHKASVSRKKKKDEWRLNFVVQSWSKSEGELLSKNDFVLAVIAPVLPLRWTHERYSLTTLIKTRTIVQSRRRLDEIVFSGITFFRTR